MVKYSTNKRLEHIFKNIPVLDKKKEGLVISSGMLEIMNNIKSFQDKIDYISKKINEVANNTITIAMLIYPSVSLEEAIDNLYGDIFVIDSMYKDVEETKTAKYVRIEEEVENLFLNTEISKHTIAKVAYLKKIIKLSSHLNKYQE